MVLCEEHTGHKNQVTAETDSAASRKTSDVKEDPKEEYQICSSLTFLYQPRHRSRIKLIGNSPI